MLINFLGTRGTHPASGQGTMSFIVDNKIVFDVCPEFVMSYMKFIESWNNANSDLVNKIQNLYGTPSFSKIEYIFLTHLHYDHWGGLRHFLIWSQMFESSFREDKPIHVFVPKKNLELFQTRMRELFNLQEKERLSEDEFFLRYLIVEIDTSLTKYIKIHAIEGGEKIQIGKYEVETFENKHFRGSLSYKFISSKFKLREEQLEKFQIQKGPLLSKLQRESKIELNNKIINAEDIFTIKKTILAYSGDTQIDIDLLEWFKDCTHLVHESTYFEDEDIFHTDSHSTLNELMPIITEFVKLQIFMPVHFSGRYTWQEIETKIAKLRESNNKFSIISPKIGTVIYYDDKEVKNSLEELPITEKF